MIVAYKEPTCIIPKNTKEEKDRYENTMNEEKNRVLVDNFNIEISTQLIRGLQRCEWLNDELVNYYIEMINQRNNNKHIYCFNSHFWTKLAGGPYAIRDSITKKIIKEGISKGSYKEVKRWSKRNKFKLMELKQLYFVINENISHWTLICINVAQKKFQYYDSNNSDSKTKQGYTEDLGNPPWRNILCNYVTKEAKEYSKFPNKYKCNWELHNEKSPKQTDGSSCGVFALRNLDLLSAGCPLNYKQEDMNNFRIRIFTDIINKRLITQ